MPNFKVRTPISYGKRNDKGEVETKEYGPGDSIDLTVEEASKIPHAIEKAPVSAVKLPKDIQEAVDSIRNRPEHKDSGVQADWKVDEFARANAGGMKKGSEVELAAAAAVGGGFERSNEPDETTGGKEKVGGIVKASDIPPGAFTKDGVIIEPKGGAVEEGKKQTENKNPASVK